MENSIRSEFIQKLHQWAGNSDLFCDFIDAFPYPIQIFAPDGTLKAVNAAFISEFRIPHPGLIVDKYNILRDETLSGFGVLGEVHSAFEGNIASVLGIPAPVHQLKQWFHIPVESSELYYLNISAFPLKSDTGEVLCVVIIYVTQKKMLDREEIARAKEYMEANWREKFDLGGIAHAALMSEAHFARRFKMFTGMTPHAYYISIKMQRLKDALLDANLSVEQAFSYCGLQYHGHYAQLFKKETGLTPSEYRRLALGKVTQQEEP
ncbi:MAG: helix-turn-helix domain-containing protein [Bacillota bacterium]